MSRHYTMNMQLSTALNTDGPPCGRAVKIFRPQARRERERMGKEEKGEKGRRRGGEEQDAWQDARLFFCEKQTQESCTLV
jgi:hypothetical protein